MAALRPPISEGQFWNELAIGLGLAVKTKDTSRVAHTVLDALDEEWDDDYVADDGSLTTSLYETLDAAAKRYAQGQDSEGDEDEEDDESIAGLSSDLHIQPKIYGLKAVYDWIQDETLVLSPEWQRNFVWKAKKQKRLIESILLGLPIPSFLIFDAQDGKKYVIDGRQRLETIARFKSPKEKRNEQKQRFRTFNAREPGWGPADS